MSNLILLPYERSYFATTHRDEYRRCYLSNRDATIYVYSYDRGWNIVYRNPIDCKIYTIDPLSDTPEAAMKILDDVLIECGYKLLNDEAEAAKYRLLI